MKIGYARVSTLEQTLDLQIDALKQAGCKKIITDKNRGSVADRSGLMKLKEDLREGDTVVVWRLDRLGRSLKHLIQWINELQTLGVGFTSLQESITTTTSTGQLIFHVFGALAEFERNLIRERSKSGLAAARARGRLGGRPKQLESNKRKLTVKLYQDREHTVQEICRMMGISKPTLYQYLREQDEQTT
jgi:DNA invertase Pin-like site-specific DNA recombinase